MEFKFHALARAHLLIVAEGEAPGRAERARWGTGVGAGRWCAAAGVGGRKRGMAEAAAAPPSVPPLPALSCRWTSEPPGARPAPHTRAFPRESPRARKAAIGELQLWPRSSRRVASPALVGKAADASCSHGVITPGVRSPACVWVVLRREAARGATGGVETGRRPPSSGCLSRSSLAAPRRTAGRPLWLLKEDLSLESGLDGQWSWVRSKGW